MAECAGSSPRNPLQLLPALAFHGRYIERYLSTYFSPNTHLLGEAVALFFLWALCIRKCRGRRAGRNPGGRLCCTRRAAGVSGRRFVSQQLPHYHVLRAHFFLYARLLAARNGMEIPPAYDQALGRMLDVVAALAQAGPAEGFGDDDGGRLWNPRRIRRTDA